jgi:hypothetical protein
MDILGYFDSSGNSIYDTEDANSSLKNIVDGVPLDDMRPAGITYVSFCFDHDYNPLRQPGIPQVHSKLEWYIPIPVEQVISTDDAGVVFSQVTYAVPGQISTMSRATFRSQMLNPLGTLGLVGLQPSTPPATAVLSADHVMQKLQNILLQNARPHIHAALHAVICPNFNTVPEATVMQVKQAYSDAAGNVREFSSSFPSQIHLLGILSQSVGDGMLREPMHMSIATRLRGRSFVLMPISRKFHSMLGG